MSIYYEEVYGTRGYSLSHFLAFTVPQYQGRGWQGEKIEGISRSSCCQVRWAAEAKQKLKREVLFVTR